ncbi:hypothetical protein C3L33_20433, partial [Rhododendron williamsianum]
MFDSQILGLAKIPIFSFAAVFFLIVFSNSVISNLSLHSVVLDTTRSPQGLRSTLENPQKLRKIPTHELLVSVREEVDQEAKGSEDLDHHTDLLAPSTDSCFGKPIQVQPKRVLGDTVKKYGLCSGYEILKPLLGFGFRVTAVTPDLPFLFNDTPAESWFDEFKRGKTDPGEVSLAQNLSNLIRLAVLYKYGGVYLDTDFIVLKDFSGLRNSIGAQSVDAFGNWTRLNNAVLVFDKNHTLLHKFMEEFTSTFNGNRWGHNGPYLVSRVVERTPKGQDCNFTVLPRMAFYPVDWTRIAGLFAKPVTRANSKWVEAKLAQLGGVSYGVHLWNKESSRLRIEEGSIIGRLISSNCVICKDIYSS